MPVVILREKKSLFFRDTDGVLQRGVAGVAYEVTPDQLLAWKGHFDVAPEGTVAAASMVPAVKHVVDPRVAAMTPPPATVTEKRAPVTAKD